MFSETKQKHICWKFIKSESFLAVLREHNILNIKWVEVGKMSEDFWAKLYCKMCDLSWYFLLALKLSARKSEIKKKLWWYPLERLDKYKNFVCPEKIFSRKNSTSEIFESFIFWFKCCFLGDCFRTFFVVGQPLWSTFLLSPTHHKKASYGPDIVWI